jgi:hypothetical protein
MVYILLLCGDDIINPGPTRPGPEGEVTPRYPHAILREHRARLILLTRVLQYSYHEWRAGYLFKGDRARQDVIMRGSTWSLHTAWYV